MIGQTLGHYRILEKVGSGGMGVVYRARDEQLERDVALKVLPSGTLSNDASRRHFRKEALALAKLNHPNIETVYEFDTQDGMDFLVMEYVPGKTLADRLIGGALPEKEVIALGMQIAAALAEAHEHGIVHRDLKPANIALTEKGQAKVLDFGLAKLLRPPDETTADSLSSTHGAAGTLPYMSPEQLRGEQVDARSDIYTIGAVLYEMATYRRAFGESLASRLIDSVLHQTPVPPRALNPRISPELERIILKCLDKNPEHRYQSAKELLVDLRRLEQSISGELVTPAPPPKRWSRGAKLAAYGVAALVALAAMLTAIYAGGWRDRFLVRPRSPEIRSLAVLPFANLSGDADQDYFADGMTEALITDLGQIQAIRVISRTSVMKYKAARKPLPDIALELHVDAIIEGSVSHYQNLAQVTARLVYAPTDTQLWSKSYQRDLQNVLVMQGEVASAIVHEIDVKLTPQEQTRLASGRQLNPAAHEAYLKGLYHWHKGAAEETRKAREYFEQAVLVDPQYAASYAALATFYSVSTDLPAKVAIPKAKEYALRALELDDTLAQAHTALAVIRFYGDWDWPGAEIEFKRALGLNPNDAETHRIYSSYLLGLARFDEALLEVQRAQQLDPLSLYTSVNAGWTFYFVRQYERAIAQCQQALELDANSDGAHACLGQSYRAKGMREQAISESERAVALSVGVPPRMVGLARAYADFGKRTEAKKLLDDLRERAQHSYVSPYYFAMIYTALGEHQHALTALDQAYGEHDRYLTWLKVDDAFDPLRREPRFQDLLRRIGFPP
jgi:TolB-like protein/Tfp pilus assembly protein PilF/predicted Ser/Thr protein kinase